MKTTGCGVTIDCVDLVIFHVRVDVCHWDKHSRDNVTRRQAKKNLSQGLTLNDQHQRSVLISKETFVSNRL